jgi:hypothetical protein
VVDERRLPGSHIGVPYLVFGRMTFEGASPEAVKPRLGRASRPTPLRGRVESSSTASQPPLRRVCMHAQQSRITELYLWLAAQHEAGLALQSEAITLRILNVPRPRRRWRQPRGTRPWQPGPSSCR